MLCPPLPWTSPHSGAFLLSPTKMMRSLEGTQQHQLLLPFILLLLLLGQGWCGYCSRRRRTSCS